MCENKNTIKITKNWWAFSLYLMIILFILSFTIFILGLLHSIIFLSIFILFLITSILLLFSAVYITESGKYFVNSLKNQQFPHNLNSYIVDHDAFVIIHSMSDNSTDYPGFDLLIKFFSAKRFPFKIYHCYNPEDFKNVLKNEKAKYIWIFGHGWRGGVTFKWTRRLPHIFTPNKTAFSYKQIQENLGKYPKKLFIGQFHCNHIAKSNPDSIPLPEILLDPSHNFEYYVPNWKMNSLSIWIAVKHLVKEVKRTEVSVTVVEEDQCNDGCSIV
jgi:hypothetical protein